MLPVKLVRSLVLGENINYPFHHHHDEQDPNHSHDADDEHESDDPHYHNFNHHQQPKKKDSILKNPNNNNNKKKIPLLLFTPTKELISDTFRLAAIARDIGMDFHPTPSLSHLIFSWPSSSSSASTFSYSSIPSSSSSSSPFTPTATTTQQNHRPSFSSTTTSCSSNTFCGSLPNDAVPLPFPCLSTPTASLSLLRFFVSLSKGLFKLVFFNSDPHSEFERHNWFYDCPPMCLFTRVSARRVGSMDDLSRELAGHGWALYRTHKPASPENSVYLFRRKDSNRVRCPGGGGGGGGRVGECRVREMRLPELDFGKQVPLRVLLYILLMTDDVFYLAEFS